MLTDRHVLITSGPTRAPIDAVRYVGNRSSGRLGRHVALRALACGAQVTVLAGAGSLVPERRELTADAAARLRVVPVETVEDLAGALEGTLRDDPADAVVHAMAVLDYVPAAPSEQKTPSGRKEWTLRLVRSPKIIGRLRDWAPQACLVAFKLEVGQPPEELRRRALEVLRQNRADLVVANDMERIRGETHPALILDAAGRVLAEPGTKRQIARDICRLVARHLEERQG